MKIYEAIPKVARAIGAISKDRTNQQQGFKFRGIDDVLNACHAPLTDNGVFCTTEVTDLTRDERVSKNGGVLNYTTLKMKVTFYADDGSNVSTTTYGEAMDSADKSTNKAMSAALKYAFFQTFTIPIEEADDADKTTHELAPRSPAQPSQKAKPPVDPKVAAPLTPAQIAFNEWANPLVKAGKLNGAHVREVIASSDNSYSDARSILECELALEKGPNA